MIREEFCSLLIQARLRKGLSKNKISLEAKFNTIKLIRIESATHNFRINFVFDILNVLNCSLELYDAKHSYIFHDYTALLKQLKILRAQISSQDKFISNMPQFCVQTLRMVECGRTKMSIDFFLNYVQALGLSIKIIDND